MNSTEQSGYFAGGRNWLYGTFHGVAADVPLRAAVLFVHPFGEERKSAYRHLVLIARTLARKGIASFRFDLSGAGESTGEHGDASVTQWVEDARCAALLLGGQCSSAPVIAAGVRFGANLALRLALMDSRIGGCLLVEPILSGADYLRDLQRRKQIKEMMGGGRARTSIEEMDAKWLNGQCVDLDGFEIGPDMAREMRAIDLVADLKALDGDRRVACVRVGGFREFPASWHPVRDAVEAAGGRASILREKPFWGQIEYYESEPLIRTVVEAVEELAAQ